MNIIKLKIDVRSIGTKKLLVDVTPAYVYKNGVKTNEIEGYRYGLVLPEIGFERLSVKILGDKLIEQPEQYAEVDLEGLELNLYHKGGSYDVSATATGIRLAKGA